MTHDHYVTKTSSVKQWSNISSPRSVQLNDHNINDVYKALFELHNISDLLFHLINVSVLNSYCNTVVTFAQILSFIY